LKKNRPEQWKWYSETVTVERFLYEKGLDDESVCKA
jgi:hypothetical protein